MFCPTKITKIKINFWHSKNIYKFGGNCVNSLNEIYKNIFGPKLACTKIVLRTKKWKIRIKIEKNDFFS